MSDDARLVRIEQRLEIVAADVLAIKLTLAEARGAKKAFYLIASALGAIAGYLSSSWHR